MEVETVLVAVAGSDASTTATGYAVAVAERYDAGVHVLYILDERAREREERLMVDVEAAGGDVALSHSTVTGFSTDSLSRYPGSVVLDAAEDVGADFLVLPRDPPGDTLGKAAEYVLQYADQPVLSV